MNQSPTFLSTIYGKSPYGVLIEESATLSDLVEKAEKLTILDFQQKGPMLTALVMLAFPKNAWYLRETDPIYKEIVFSEKSLSVALAAGAACCRYQAVLFWILSTVARLGVRSYIMDREVSGNLRTCFNLNVESVDADGHWCRVKVVSIFKLSCPPDKSYLNNSEVLTYESRSLCGSIIEVDAEPVLIESIDNTSIISLELKRIFRRKI
jgi:hypothetical protein